MDFDEDSSSETEFDEDAVDFDGNDTNVYFIAKPFDDAAKKADRWKSKTKVQLSQKARKMDDRKELEKRVSNGDKLDTKEEATFSKLSAAHESHKKHDREQAKQRGWSEKAREARIQRR